MSDPKKELAKSRYLAGETIVSIASVLGVDRKTVQRWIDAGDWRELKEANQAVARAHGKANEPPKPSKVVSFQPREEKPKSARTPLTRDIEGMTDLELIEAAISDLYASLPNAEDRSKGGIANAISKLIEHKQKLNPPTIEELADQTAARLRELGFDPREFWRVLRERWGSQKRA